MWLTSLGLAVIIGTALFISSAAHGNQLRRWQILRLFMMPFFVSSFAALVKGRNFVLIFPRTRGKLRSRWEFARSFVSSCGF
jgi:hypothetical protein